MFSLLQLALIPQKFNLSSGIMKSVKTQSQIYEAHHLAILDSTKPQQYLPLSFRSPEFNHNFNILAHGGCAAQIISMKSIIRIW